MKTMRKKEYVAPKMEILMVEMEEGIAGASPTANPSTNSWDQGSNGSLEGSGDYEDGAF